MNSEETENKTWLPTPDEQEALHKVLKDFTKGRSVTQKTYNYFNGRALTDVIDDWTERWNGYIQPLSTLDEQEQSNIYLNITRNIIIGYLSKVALSQAKVKIVAVNKTTGMVNKKLSEVLEDLNAYSNNEENQPARYLEAAMECAVKGTVISYEGYKRSEVDCSTPDKFNSNTGKITSKKEKRVLFDNCYQQVIPLEDFFIANPYEPDIQKQPWVIWRQITTFSEFKQEFGRYKNAEFVREGNYNVAMDSNTFYRNSIYTDLHKDQVEILRYYCRYKNRHIIVANGVVLYDGIIPFKDGKYPFAKTVNEPYGNDFFWGMGIPQKFMGEQDTANNFINAMIDKTDSSLLPFGLTSDIDDMLDDQYLEPNKIRKVSDINKWKFDTLPGVSSSEQNMFQTILSLGKENSGMQGGGGSYSPKGGKLGTRQILLQQQEAMSKIGFSINYLEDFERDRTELRLAHILQFYSIPKIEKITGKGGKEIEKMLFRDVKLSNVELSDGRKGNKVIKLVSDLNSDKQKQLEDSMSVDEAMGEETGNPTEVLALNIDTFNDYNLSVQVVKYSSYEKNAVLDQAARMEYAQWRLGLLQVAPANVDEIIKFVEESYDIDSDRFAPTQQPQQATPEQGQQSPRGSQGIPQGVAQQMKPSNLATQSAEV
jgi:hypothetical protein